MKRVVSGLIVSCMLTLSAQANEPIVTDSTTNSTVTTNGSMTTTVKSPPPSAISPNISSSNSDLCTVGVAGAVQTQILGISMGKTFTEENCLRLKNAKTLYDMGMKVAAVSVMCKDPVVFSAMMNAGTPCPYDGQIGQAARLGWEANPEDRPDYVAPQENVIDEKTKEVGKRSLLGVLGFLLLF